MLYSPEQCENKWDSLRSKLKKVNLELANSGAAGVSKITASWPFYELMKDLVADDPAVYPTKTVAVGSSHENKSPTVEDSRMGKTRLSTLPRTSPNESALLEEEGAFTTKKYYHEDKHR